MSEKMENDMLRSLFLNQAAFEALMGYDIANMSEKERGEYVRLQTLMVTDELHEMLHEIPFFKPWKRYSNDSADNLPKWQRAKMELVDALHFFLTLCLGLGFTAEELFAMYSAKLSENYSRQKNTAEYKKDTE